MRTLGLLDGDKPTNAAAMLADKNAFPGIDMAKFGADQDTILDRETIEGVSVLTQFDKSMAFFRRYCVYESVKGATRTTIERIPEKAFREACCECARTPHLGCCRIHQNLLVGRWRRNHFARRIGSRNDKRGLPRRTLFPAQKPSTRRKHVPHGPHRKIRNGRAAHKARLRGYRLFPAFKVGDGFIATKLPFVDRQYALTAEEQAILDTIPENRLVSRSTVSEITGFEKTKTVRHLRSLVEKSYLRQEGEGRGRKYARAN